MLLSTKSQRLLQHLGVAKAFEHGERLVLVGPTYELRDDPAVTVRLAFRQDEDGRLCVGYASHDRDDWQPVESEPFSMRALGYYQRRLKRIGERID